MTIRLLVADDEELARAGVASMVRGTEIEVISQADNTDQAVKRALSERVDVALLDIRMHGQNTLEVLGQIKRQRPDLPVLIFSASDSLADISQAHELGADGYLCKTLSRDELLEAIRRAAGGKETWTRQQRRRVRSTVLTKDVGDGTALTPREIEVLKLLSEGLANEEIAERLEVNVETVKHHVKHILTKIGVEQRVQAALWAVRQGLV